MRKIFLSFLLITVAFNVNAQEILSDSIPMWRNLGNTTDSLLNAEKELPASIENIDAPAFVTPYTIKNYKYTVPTGYTNTYAKYISNGIFLSTVGKSDVWHGITTINSAHFDLHYNSEIFDASIGTSLWKYDDYSLPYRYNDVVFQAHAAYRPVGWLTLGVYGQYSTLAEKNAKKGSILPTPMVPYTGVSGYSKIMFNSTFGIQGGFGVQYNPIMRKWEPTYGIGPAFEFKRKKRK